jgi:dihydroneopterin aldolase
MARPESSSTTPDLIRIVDLELHTRIGVLQEERQLPQRLLITLEMSGESFAHAAGTDNIARTINYFDIAQFVKRIAAERERKLLETLAEDIAHDVLKNFAVKTISLEIKKFVLPDAGYVSVKMDRAHTPSHGGVGSH